MLRLRTKLYFIATGAYGAFAVLAAMSHAGMILVFSFLMTMWCYHMAMKWVSEDVEKMLMELYNLKEKND